MCVVLLPIHAFFSFILGMGVVPSIFCQAYCGMTSLLNVKKNKKNQGSFRASFFSLIFLKQVGSGDSSVAERQTHNQKVLGSSRGRSGQRIFFSRVNYLCWLLFWYLFHPRMTAAACERSWSLPQKCWWQVAAKHACTLHMRLLNKVILHVCMVYTEHAHRTCTQQVYT